MRSIPAVLVDRSTRLLTTCYVFPSNISSPLFRMAGIQAPATVIKTSPEDPLYMSFVPALDTTMMAAWHQPRVRSWELFGFLLPSIAVNSQFFKLLPNLHENRHCSQWVIEVLPGLSIFPAGFHCECCNCSLGMPLSATIVGG